MKIFNKEKYNEKELSLIKSENRKQYLQLFKSTIFVQTIFPLILCSVFYAFIPITILIAWFVATLFVTLLRVYVNYFWYKDDFDAHKTKLFELVSLFLSFLSGCLLGVTVLIMNFTQYPEASVFLILVVFGFSVGTVGIGSYWFEHFLTYNLTVFSIYVFVYFIGFPESYYSLAFYLMAFLGFMIHIVLTFHKNNAQNFWLIKRNEKMANALADKKNQAEEFADSRTRFLASASHDLRQPLQALNLFLSALEPEINSKKGLKLFNQVDKCAEGMDELLSAILDISKLDAETLIVKNESCSLDRIFENLKRQFQIQANEKSLEFSVQATSLYVYSDFILLQRILSNIIANAICYTIKGSVVLSFVIQKDKILIEVTDTGPGLDEVEQNKIFDEFYQLNNSERDKKRGLGLGLSIVKRLCSLMNVPIMLSSQKEEGSIFSIVLPLCDAVPPIEPVNELVNESALNSKKVLVIDDEANIRDGLKELLTQWHCQVMTAESEDEACEILEKTGYVPNLIIVDYRLRNNKNGVMAINTVKNFLNNKQLAAIIISGDTEPARLKEVAESGYILLHKPVRPTQLRMVIQRSI